MSRRAVEHSRAVAASRRWRSSFAVGCGPAATGVEAARRRKEDGTAGRVAAFQQVEDEVLRESRCRRSAGRCARTHRAARRGPSSPHDGRDARRGCVARRGGRRDRSVLVRGTRPRAHGGQGEARRRPRRSAGRSPRHDALSGVREGAARSRRRRGGWCASTKSARCRDRRARSCAASSTTWQPPATPREAAERDRWLARRLDEVNAAVSKGGPGSEALDVVRARELDDALDALEHATEAGGLGHAHRRARASARERSRPLGDDARAAAASDWSYVGRRVQAHLGFALAPEVLERASRVAREGPARGRRGARSRAVSSAPTRWREHAAPLVFRTPGRARVAVPGSRVRSMAPPPERIAACQLRDTVAPRRPTSPRARYALVAMHDHVVVAQWALDVARGARDDRADDGPPSPAVATRPGRRRALGAHRAAHVPPLPSAAVSRRACSSTRERPMPTTRARAWSELGEVPFDIAERELHRSMPVDERASSGDVQSGRARP